MGGQLYVPHFWVEFVSSRACYDLNDPRTCTTTPGEARIQVEQVPLSVAPYARMWPNYFTKTEYVASAWENVDNVRFYSENKGVTFKQWVKDALSCAFSFGAVADFIPSSSGPQNYSPMDNPPQTAVVHEGTNRGPKRINTTVAATNNANAAAAGLSIASDVATCTGKMNASH